MSAGLLALLVPLLATPASAHTEHEEPGYLAGTGEWDKIELVSHLDFGAGDGRIADVGVDPSGDYAYVAHWGVTTCAAPSERGGRTAPDSGIYVVDISDPENPVQVGFIPSSQDSRIGEGVQAVEISTAHFDGTMLVTNNEQCGPQGKGGVTLYDVTDPLDPKKLSKHFGDRNGPDTNDIHSAFAWDAGDNAYVVIVDNFEGTDVDILDITNPKRPRLVTELNLNEFVAGGVDQEDIGLTESFLHDMVVKQIDGTWYMLLSYWDGGFVVLNVDDPLNPEYVLDTDYPALDPLLPVTADLTPEGNAHQAEWTLDNRFFIGTDEDFSPYRGVFEITSGDAAGEYPAGEFSWTVPIVETDGFDGVTVYGGYGCLASPETVPTADEVRADLGLGPDDQVIVVFQRGPVGDPSAPYEACTFSEKVELGQDLGYDAVIIANHHTGAQGGAAPDASLCGSMGHEFEVTVSAICVGHQVLHLLFGSEPGYTYPEASPAVGDVGETVAIDAVFDGWGYVTLYDAATGDALDHYAIPEAHDPAYAFGFGDLTVHEVATDPQDPSLAYLSYYGGGLRALQIQCTDPADTSTCELVEVGGYLDPEGNNFWGVEAFVGDDGFTYILGSDRDSGLWIFRDP
ncbi:MAG TPA: hypothetical protein VFU14_14545 [Acidimicrobiales bacterium]|nr:hypothetical protein [Acidimicrobiales bacterium]